MTRAAKLLPALSFAATMIALACVVDEPPAPSKVAAPKIDVGAGAGAGAGASEAGPVAEDGMPKIASDAAVYEFGAIKATDSIEHVFAIRNVGTADLKIERVQRT